MIRAALAVTLLLGCSDPPVAPPSAPPPPDPGREAVLRYECNRCHAIDDVPAPDPHAACVGCHAEIAAGTFDAPADALAEWRPHVEPLSEAPSLRGAGRRLRRAWIARFLREPHDLRPALAPTMPRLAIDAADAAAIARFLVPDDPGPEESLDPSLVERGRALYRDRGCAGCHAFGGSGEDGTGEDRLAPDLRFARERLSASAIVRQIRAPRAASPDGTMPSLAPAADDARALAAFVLHAPLAPWASSGPPARLPVLEREVTFAEVERHVFRRVCWHCHSDPDFALGDGGPGNQGGFGFEARGLDLSSYEGVLSGAVDDDGQPVSIFRPGPDGTPHLVRTLLARQAEEAGQPIEGVRGMPLGYPAVSPEDVQLVETWIAQGRPR